MTSTTLQLAHKKKLALRFRPILGNYRVKDPYQLEMDPNLDLVKNGAKHLFHGWKENPNPKTPPKKLEKNLKKCFWVIYFITLLIIF